MEYRTMPHTGDAFSTIAIGGANLSALSDGEMAQLLDCAEEHGLNVIDLAVDSSQPFSPLGAALRGRREKMRLSLHLGLNFNDQGQYLRTQDIPTVRKTLEWELKTLRTDYADIGYLHYIDTPEDYERIFSSGLFEYALRLRREGRIRHLGFDSHNVAMADKMLDTGEMDVFLFSINPAYDLDPVTHNPLEEDLSELDALNVAKDREALYRRAEKLGVAINVMKPLAAGRLLNARTSPFGRVMTIPQCIQYCLDRPAVMSCMVGVRNAPDLRDVLHYYEASADERDYSFIAQARPKEMLGQCMYCNHCQPCPAGIDIAAVHKFLDLAKADDALAHKHYRALEHKASDCLGCGSCEDNCPFQVSVREKMKEAEKLFDA